MVIDALTGEFMDFGKRAIVSINDEIVEYGYVKEEVPTCRLLIRDEGSVKQANLLYNQDMDQYITFSKHRGCYVLLRDFDSQFILEEENILGCGGFPYSFARNYEAMYSFDIFKGKQQVVDEKKFELANYLKYTFGVEFETSMGYVPENLCFRDGLIPLRDGSISGLEYSTVVLGGNTGLNLLAQQVETLNKYTFFNKECSLHIHFGGYPLDPKSIYVLYTICTMLESELQYLTPEYTFKTSKYKKSGKDYCKFLPKATSFNDLYELLTDRKYLGDLTQPHPRDPDRTRKWECHSRYTWLNVLNMVCYRKCKTVEFRFLRPTFNLNKIIIWMYIFNGIMMYSEKLASEINSENYSYINRRLKSICPSLVDIIHSVYPVLKGRQIIEAINKLKISRINQSANEDYFGKDIELDNRLFTELI